MILGFASKLTTMIVAVLLLSAAAVAQDLTPSAQANPAPGCNPGPAEVEANRKVAMDFFRVSGEARVALLDPSYKQHNPVMVQRAQQEHLSDYEEAKNAFLAQAKGPVVGLGLGPTPPGNRFEIVTAECDIVTIVHSGFRHDPTGQTKFYEAFTFDTFRVKGGRLVEHWDGASLSTPAGAPTSTAKPN
jgi:predicted SnoaL-like aldol condensation-catalyzing enzyme